MTSSRDYIGMVLSSIVELQERTGVTPREVRRYVDRRHGELPNVTEERLTLAMERAVKVGFLAKERGRYRLDLTSARGGGCPCASKRRANRPKKSRSRKACKKSKKSRSARRKQRAPCGGPGIMKRLKKMLLGKKKRNGCKKGGKRGKKPRKTHTWVRKHCRRLNQHPRRKRSHGKKKC